MEFQFFETPCETKIGSTEGSDTTFGSSYWEVRKIGGSRNQDSTVHVPLSTVHVPLPPVTLQDLIGKVSKCVPSTYI